MAVLPSYLMYIYEPYQLLVYFLVSIGTTALCFALTCLFAIPAEVQVPDQETDAVESTAAEIESFIEEPALRNALKISPYKSAFEPFDSIVPFIYFPKICDIDGIHLFV